MHPPLLVKLAIALDILFLVVCLPIISDLLHHGSNSDQQPCPAIASVSDGKLRKARGSFATFEMAVGTWVETEFILTS